MLKKFFVVLAVLLAVVLVLCWIYLPSFSRYRELKQEEEKLQKRIREIDSQIRSLTDEKYLLQNDVTYLEKVIREELGFVKPGEIIYEMITKKDAGDVKALSDPAAGIVNPTNPESRSNSILPATEAEARSPVSNKIGTKISSKTRTVRTPSAKTDPVKRRPKQN